VLDAEAFDIDEDGVEDVVTLSGGGRRAMLFLAPAYKMGPYIAYYT